MLKSERRESKKDLLFGLFYERGQPGKPPLMERDAFQEVPDLGLNRELGLTGGLAEWFLIRQQVGRIIAPWPAVILTALSQSGAYNLPHSFGAGL